MPSPSSAPLPTWWLRIWIALGACVLGLIVFIPAYIYTTITAEGHRFEDCEKGVRSDCRPSIIWYFAGWVEPSPIVTGNSLGKPSTTTAATATPPAPMFPLGATNEELTASSTVKITAIKLVGGIQDGHIFQMQGPTTTVWTITAPGAKTVELFVKQGPTATPNRVLALKLQKDGSFQGTWKVPAILAELQVRAVGSKNDRHTLFFAVAATP